MIMLSKPSPSDPSPNASLPPVLWAAIEKIGHKELNADQLTEDSSHEVRLKLSGTVDGRPFEQAIESVVEIGPRHEKSSSVNPQVGELIACILSKLNAATRARILADIPAEFMELGKMPKSRPDLVAETKSMLKKLRSVKIVNARGPVRCQYVLAQTETSRGKPPESCSDRCGCGRG